MQSYDIFLTSVERFVAYMILFCRNMTPTQKNTWLLIYKPYLLGLYLESSYIFLASFSAANSGKVTSGFFSIYASTIL